MPEKILNRTITVKKEPAKPIIQTQTNGVWSQCSQCAQCHTVKTYNCSSSKKKSNPSTYTSIYEFSQCTTLNCSAVNDTYKYNIGTKKSNTSIVTNNETYPILNKTICLGQALQELVSYSHSHKKV